MSSDYIFKYLTLGDFSVGKTLLTLRFSGEKMPKKTISTIGIDFKTKTFTLKNGKIVKLLLYDTAGQEKFRNIAANYYNGTDCALLVFDLTKPDTLKILTYWINDLAERVNQNEGNFEIILIGNKKDLEEERAVTKESIDEMCEKYKMKYFEVSAMTGEGIQELVDYCYQRVEFIIAARENNDEDDGYNDNRISNLEALPVKKKKKSKKNQPNCCKK